jgi:hypothetical protein
MNKRKEKKIVSVVVETAYLFDVIRIKKQPRRRK